MDPQNKLSPNDLDKLLPIAHVEHKEIFNAGSIAKIITVIIVVLIIITTAATSFLVLSLKSKIDQKPQVKLTKKTSSSKLISAPSPVITKTIDETANWRIYKTNDFEFKYPNNYPLLKWKEETLGQISFSDELASLSILEEPKGDGPVSNSDENLNVNSYKAKKIKGYIGAIGGMVPQSFIEYQIFHPDGKRFFLITMYELTVKEEEKFTGPERPISSVPANDEKIFQQIISTFKFTN